MKKIYNLTDIKDYIFKKSFVFRDGNRRLLLSSLVKTGYSENVYYVEILNGIFTDKELLNLINKEKPYGGHVEYLDNKITEIHIYND